MQDFNDYKSNCEYNDKVKVTRNNHSNGSYLGCPPTFYENCTHPLAGKSKEVTSKICDEKNDFCPYYEINEK